MIILLTIGGYNTRTQFFSEISDALNTQFSDALDAFEYFLSHESQRYQLKREVCQDGFKKAINGLLPGRLQNEDHEYVWKRISLGLETINITKFIHVFSGKRYTGSKVNLTQR